MKRTIEQTKQGNSSSVKRVQLDLPPRAMERLQSLKIKTEAGSYAEVLRNALHFYELLVESNEKGNDVYIKEKEKEKEEKIKIILVN